MNPKAELERFKGLFDKELENYLREKEENYKNISPFVFEFFKNISEFTLRGGKRLRPALVYHAYRLFEDDKEEEIIKLSIFVELIQTSLLIHDDIFDRAATRRKGLTFHKIYEEASVKNDYNDPLHFGNTLGILGGDIAAQLSNELITNSDFPADRKNKVLSIVASLTTDVLIGQIEDFIITFKENYQEEDIEKIFLFKTVKYTFEMPLLTGAILAGKKEDDKDIMALKEYAKFAGMAFQLRDDILGTFGDEEKMGKPATSDIEEGKKTLLVLRAQQNANELQQQILKTVLGKRNLSEKEAKDFRDVLVNTGSLNYSKNKCDEYISKAKDALLAIESQGPSKDFLSSLADYMVVRNI